MKVGYHISFVKTKVIIAAAAIFMVLAADWCSPGIGLHQAALSLGGYGSLVSVKPSLWGWIVKLIGWDVRKLGTLSLVTALVALSIYAAIVSSLVRHVVKKAKLKCVKGTHRYDGVTSSVSVLAAASFLFTPGFLMAATRVDPLMLALSLILAGIAVLLRICLSSPWSAYQALKEHVWRGLFAMTLVGIGVWELLAMGRFAFFDAMRVLAWFAVIGVMPLLTFVHRVRFRKLIKPQSMMLFLACWAAFIAVSGVRAVVSNSRGREVSRLVEQIIGDAHGCDAILSEGYLDDMLLFTKPRGLRLISFVRDNDDKYRRDLAQWVEGQGLHHLVWAAEIGPRTLIDEWIRTDSTGCLQRVRTSAYYFPTVAKWREGCNLMKRISASEPLGAYMRKLVTACGNDIGCRFLDEGDTRSAWALFWEILHKIDARNCTAIANLYAMIKRGYQPLSSEREELDRLNRRVVAYHRSARRILWEAFTGGRIYLRTEGGGRLVNTSSDYGQTSLTDREREFVRTVSAAPNSSMSAEKAREAIRAGVVAKLVRLDRIGPQLLRLDIALNDWSVAEKDALSILDISPRHPTANGILGLIRYRQGRYGDAEFHLRATLKVDRSNVAALNDLAMTLLQLGRFDEAMHFAEAAVRAKPEDWNFLETLALVQIRGWNPTEGARTLQKSIKLAESFGIRRSDIVRFDLDYAWLCAAQHDAEALSAAVAALEKRTDLKPLEQKELAELKATVAK